MSAYYKTSMPGKGVLQHHTIWFLIKFPETRLVAALLSDNRINLVRNPLLDTVKFELVIPDQTKLEDVPEILELLTKRTPKFAVKMNEVTANRLLAFISDIRVNLLLIPVDVQELEFVLTSHSGLHRIAGLKSVMQLRANNNEDLSNYACTINYKKPD